MKSKFPTPGKYDLGIFPPEILGHIEYNFGKPTKPALPAGTHVLDIKFGLPDERDWLLYVPESLDATKPAKLLLMYHGAGGFADKVMPFFKEHADKNGFLLVIPQSTYVTWDLTVGGNGPDLEKLQKAMNAIGENFEIDRNHCCICGFSDGASYSLSIGLSNGECFSHVIALSGGFMNLYVPRGKPLVFIAHSPEDEQLPMDTAGLWHYNELKKHDYDVEFFEFHGRHVIHPHVVDKAIEFFMTRSPGR